MKQHNASEMHGKQIVFTKQANDFIKKTQKTPLAEIRKAHAIIRQLEV